MKPSSVCRNVFHLLFFTLLPLLTTGCAGGSGQEITGNTYTVRARVQQLPSQGSGLYLEHEAIDNWIGRSGQVEGMHSMTMPFPLAKGVSLEGIGADDIVEAQIHVDWEADLPVRITALRELPRDTELEFRAAQPKP